MRGVAITIGAILAGLTTIGSFVIGGIAQLAASAVDIVTAVFSNIDKIALIYVITTAVFNITMGMNKVPWYIYPFDVFARMELSLLTPVTSIESLSPLSYDLELILNPFSAWGGEAGFNALKSEKEASGVSTKEMDMALEGLQFAQGMVSLIIGWLCIMATFVKYSLFASINYNFLTAILSWYNTMNVTT